MSTESRETETRTFTIATLIRRGAVVVILLVGLLGAYLYWGRADHGPKVEAPPPPQGPLSVQTTIVQRRSVPLEPEFLGQTVASQDVEIRSRVRGYLLERSFEEGSRVQQGQVLFRIDPRPFQVELDMARARLASAEAKLERARSQLRRFEEVVARQAGTASELEQWQTEERVAAAEVQLAQANIAQAELNLSYTTIESPITGMIGRALKDVGSYIDDGANGLLAVVQQVDPIYVQYSVSEQELLRWQRMAESGIIDVPELGAVELQITLSDGGIYPYRGRLNFVDIQVDPSTGTALVRGSVPNPEHTLRPGQFVHVRVMGIVRKNVVLVPQQAVMQTVSGSSVYVVNAQGQAETRTITLGDWVGNDWIVESGLQGGEEVIVDRLMQVRPGMPVLAERTDDSTNAAPAAATAFGRGN